MTAATPATQADGLTIQPLRWWHLDAVMAIEQATFGDTAWSLEQFYGELAAPGRWLQGLFDSQGLHGYVDVGVAGSDADLMTVAIRESLRGAGWGGRLVASGMAHAQAAGATAMFCEVRSDNPAARLYERLGFVAIDRRRDYYRRGIDAIVMRCRLRANPQGGSR